MFDNIKADFARVYRVPQDASLKAKLRGLFYALIEYGFWAVLVYRFGKFANSIRIPIIGFLLRVIYFIAKTVVEIISGIMLEVDSDIGPGLYIGHFGCIHILATIGKN